MSNDQKQLNPLNSLPYECELCGGTEMIPLEIIEHFDLVDPGLPGQPATCEYELCSGIMFPQVFLRAQRRRDEGDNVSDFAAARLFV